MSTSSPRTDETLRNAAAAAILTPKPGPAPRINGPKIFGVRPGSVFLYTIPATGDRPMTFMADDLPAGLRLDKATGQISGRLETRGEYRVTLRAKNAVGEATRAFRIVVGDEIALTPPMGWNSWNCWSATVSQEKVLASAHAMVAKGLRDHGWTYINIDDGWQSVRGGPDHAIQPNAKFPDMKGLADEIHALGLKFGIYSTPWRGTYEGHIGSTGDHEDGAYDWVKAGTHNEFYLIGTNPENWETLRRENYFFGKYSFVRNDVKQWAEWGADYLKYDWEPNDVPHVAEIHEALRATNRDIVLSLSNNAPYEGAADWSRLSNAWRTTGDIRDIWEKVCQIGFVQDRWAPYAKPGHWNDPDMLVVGQVGWGPALHPTALTPDEQYSHVSLWSLLAAPLLIGCDISKMDDVTVGLLTNDEVIEINQDTLGRQATRVWSEDDRPVFAKKLEDGSYAVGLFNRGPAEKIVWTRWRDLGIRGKYRVRDLWRQKDLGVFDERVDFPVPSHGVLLLRLFPET